MALYCSACGYAAGAEDQFCAKCGQRLTPENFSAESQTARPAEPAPNMPSGAPPAAPGAMEDHIAAMLCYIPFIGWVPALVFLFTDPYRRNRGLRFHAFQSLFTFASVVAIDVVLGVVTLGAMPLFYELHQIFYLAVVVLFVVMMIKTYQRQSIRLPIVGDWAARQV